MPFLFKDFIDLFLAICDIMQRVVYFEKCWNWLIYWLEFVSRLLLVHG